jgi:tetratricopeptide (TPR) repeat protein
MKGDAECYFIPTDLGIELKCYFDSEANALINTSNVFTLQNQYNNDNIENISIAHLSNVEFSKLSVEDAQSELTLSEVVAPSSDVNSLSIKKNENDDDNDNETTDNTNLKNIMSNLKKRRDILLQIVYERTAGENDDYLSNLQVNVSSDVRINTLLYASIVLISSDKLNSVEILFKALEVCFLYPVTQPSLFNEVVLLKHKDLIPYQRNVNDNQYFLIWQEDVIALASLYKNFATLKALTKQINTSLTYIKESLSFQPNDLPTLELAARLYNLAGRPKEALEYINKAIYLTSNVTKSQLYERGKIYQDLGLIQKALSNLFAAEKIKSDDDSSVINSKIWHIIAKCEKEVGTYQSTMSAFNKSLELHFDPGVLMDRGWIRVEFGDSENSIQDLNRVLELEPNAALAHGYKGLLMHTTGRYKDAIISFEKSLAVGSGNDKQCYLFLAVSNQALGNFTGAKKYFDALLLLDKNHIGWFQREYLYYIVKHLFDPMSSFNIDANMNVLIKEGFAWKNKDMIISAKSIKTYYSLNDFKLLESWQSSATESELENHMKNVINTVQPFTKWIQLDSEGFVPNKRQHRMFGLSVLEMAQELRYHITKLQKGELGLLISDDQTSNKSFEQFKSCNQYNNNETCPSGMHIFGWRDFFDIAVKWRQISEPNDAVFWLDKFSNNTYTGLNTYMLKNSNKVKRYYTYYSRSIEVAKKIITTNGIFDG